MSGVELGISPGIATKKAMCVQKRSDYVLKISILSSVMSIIKGRVESDGDGAETYMTIQRAQKSSL